MNLKQELFEKINYHIITDEQPSLYFNDLLKNKLFYNEHPFTLLSDLKNVEQSPTHHPEGSVWNHTMMVIDIAAKIKEQSDDKEVFMWAALLHDIGKTATTKLRNGKITAYVHDKLGEKLSIKFLNPFVKDEAFIINVSLLVRWHMQLMFVVKNMPFAQINKMKSQVNINEIALLGFCDRLGRGGSKSKIEVEQDLKIFKDKCSLKNNNK